MAREQVKLVSTAKKFAKAKPVAPAVLLDAKGRRLGNDPWIYLEDGQPAEDDASVVVSVKRLQGEAEALLQRGPVGVQILPSDAIEEIGAYIPQLSLIAVDFPIYRDGRGFSTARLARERYHFKGDLRAVGDVLQDLVFFMLRCGFSSFALKARNAEAAFTRAARSFSEVYQPAADGRGTIIAARAGRARETKS
jgi:uncharacterized protein (DUF934 family)